MLLMKRKMVSAVTLTLLLTSMLTLAFNVRPITGQGQIATGVLGIDFVDEYDGWAVGCAGLILHTIDGGANWKVQNWTHSGDSRGILYNVKFSDLNNGWAVGTIPVPVPLNDTGIPHETIDSIGQVRVGRPPYHICRAFFFFDTSSLTDNATISSAILSLYSHGDGSDTDFYVTVQNGQPAYPHEPLVPEDYNHVYYSGNGGSISTSDWVSMGYNNISLNTDGISWINKTGTTKFCIRSSRDINSNIPTGSEHVSIRLADFPAPQEQACPKLTVTYNNITEVFYSSKNDATLYVADESYSKAHDAPAIETPYSLLGAILHTSNGGEYWEIQMTWKEGGEYGWHDLHSVEFINATHGWVGGQYAIFRTVDGGLNWTRQLSPWGYTVFDIQFMDENIGWACGTDGVWRTNDGGETWDLVYISGGSAYYNMDFVNLLDGWVISNFGIILHSGDGGNSWIQQYDTGGPILTDVDFVNTTHGWVTCNDGRVFHTNNGGATYDFDSFVDDRDWRGLYVDSEARVYAVGGAWKTAFGQSNCLLAVIEKSGNFWEIQLAPSMVFNAEKAGEIYQVRMDADSTLTEFSFDVSTESISFNVFGPNGFRGNCKITIPKSLVGVVTVNFNVYIDGIKTSCSMTETDTDYILNISYTHSSHVIGITPIFPDMDRDGEIGLSDLVLLAKAYDSRLGYPNWDLRCDLDGNGKVGLSDLVLLARNYGKE
jgi:photosystem II stability/assembly factor-like uncharacterized protein